ncbi:hypothetical protein PR048_024719 [Dryococelus australis]|uniref:DDE-1 domain-containing protein n=1 Tax=Dryococelus australis TaxID=614101 RepID=A0ABQ9GPE7_9NEOP|nr:hypothetical protein PR048_024719 [Dryococelus australis]
MNSWMDTSIFIEWYETVFNSEVKKHQLATSNPANVLLLIDNAQSHPSTLSEKTKFKSVFLLPYVTSVLQQMDEGVIESFKHYYRKTLLYMKEIDLKDTVLYMAAEAWATVKDTTLAKTWYKLLPSDESITAPENVAGLMKKLQDLKNTTRKTFKTGSNVMSMTLAIKYRRTMKSFPVSSTTKTLVTTRKEEPSSDRTKIGPSSEEAFHCLETAMKWLEQQEDCYTAQLLSLKRFRDLTAKKRLPLL